MNLIHEEVHEYKRGGVGRLWGNEIRMVNNENIFPLVNDEFTMVIRIKYQESLEYTRRLEHVRKMNNKI
jgi:hypothetical protein